MKIEHKEKDLFIKLCRYCAYRERAISEVVDKMNKLEIKKSVQKKLIIKLQEENFLNEQRFADSFVRGKFNNNKWGRNKIYKTLLLKKVPTEFIEHALENLDDNLYYDSIKDLALKKYKRTKAKNVFEARSKVANYLQRKGYEIDIVWQIIKSEIKD